MTVEHGGIGHATEDTTGVVVATNSLEPRARSRHEQVLLELLKDCWGPPGVRDEWRGVVLDWCEEHDQEAWRLGLEWARESGGVPKALRPERLGLVSHWSGIDECF